MLYGATQGRWAMVENSDKTWLTGKGNGKPPQYSCLENSMNSMKRQNDMTLADELSQVRKCPIFYWGKAEDNYDTIITPERMK